MRSSRWGSLAILFCAAAAADPARQASPDYLATIVDDDAQTLPRGLSSDERALWRLPAAWELPFSAPPGASVRAQAEYEPTDGILIRWGSYNALHTQMVVAITTGDATARVFVVVSGSSQQASASGVLSAGGANMSRVKFIIAPTDSVWMRDYGPRFIDDYGRRGMIDHVYNRPRPNDDAFPAALSTQWSEPDYAIPLTHGGGNFHLFKNRDAFMTRLIVNENPSLSETQIKDYYLAYQGLNVTLFDPFPTSYDSTQHIDMWVLPLSDDKIIVSQYAASEGTPQSITDGAAMTLSTRGYTVYRTPGWKVGSTHYTYANGVILNSLALVCQFNGYPTQNLQAVTTYQSALPDHQIVPIDCSAIISQAGAIHCIVMHVPDLLYRSGYDD